MPPISNAELLAGIEKAIETKLESKLSEKLSGIQELSEKFSGLTAELSDLRDTNAKLIALNKALIDENASLRRSRSSSAASDASHDLSFRSTDSAAKKPEPESEIPPHLHRRAGVPLKSLPPAMPLNIETRDYDVLVLSDSILRHVHGSIPKAEKEKHPLYQDVILDQSVEAASELTVLKCVTPGARCDRLWADAVALSQKHSFREVIVSVGANYIPSRQTRRRGQPNFKPAADVIDDICDLLAALNELFQCHVSFMAVPPRVDRTYFNLIQDINAGVDAFCREQWFGVVRVEAFCLDHRGHINEKLFAKTDGIHLAGPGINAVEVAIDGYLRQEYFEDFLYW